MALIPLSLDSVAIFLQDPAFGFISLLLQDVTLPSPNKVRLDLSETEDYDRTWNMTRQPVQRVTATNRTRNPDRLVIVGVLSANPLLRGLLDFAGLGRLDKKERAKLKGLLTRAPKLFVATPEDYYPNMGCVGFKARNDDSTGKGTRLTLAFEEFQIATPGFVEGELDLTALGAASGGESPLGSQTPATVPDPGGFG